MSITVSDGSTTLALPEDLAWSDEHGWQPVAQSVATTLTGALIVESAVMQAGRPITLEGRDESAWIDGAALAQLAAWAALPGQALSVTLRGEQRQVVFRHQDAPALAAVPIVDYSDPGPTDWYAVTIKWMEI